MNVWTIILLSFFLLGAVLTVVTVGQPRKPVTGGTAATILVIDILLSLCVLKASGAL